MVEFRNVSKTYDKRNCGTEKCEYLNVQKGEFGVLLFAHRRGQQADFSS